MAWKSWAFERRMFRDNCFGSNEWARPGNTIGSYALIVRGNVQNNQIFSTQLEKTGPKLDSTGMDCPCFRTSGKNRTSAGWKNPKMVANSGSE
jgi:hypothetical protein